MLEKLLGMLSGTHQGAARDGQDELNIAVAALLIEAGRMDERFDDRERRVIRDLLTAKFDLRGEALEAVVAAAEAKVETTEQYYPFTDLICKRMTAPERVELIEMLWRVVYADGALDPYEDSLIRQVAALIYVDDRERANARKRALAALGKPE